MPHKRAKKASRDSQRQSRGADLAPGSIHSHTEKVPKSLQRVLNADQIRKEYHNRSTEQLSKSQGKQEQNKEKKRKRDDSQSAQGPNKKSKVAGSSSGSTQNGGTVTSGKSGKSEAPLKPQKHESLAQFSHRVDKSLSGGITAAFKAARTKLEPPKPAKKGKEKATLEPIAKAKPNKQQRKRIKDEKKRRREKEEMIEEMKKDGGKGRGVGWRRSDRSLPGGVFMPPDKNVETDHSSSRKADIKGKGNVKSGIGSRTKAATAEKKKQESDSESDEDNPAVDFSQSASTSNRKDITDIVSAPPALPRLKRVPPFLSRSVPEQDGGRDDGPEPVFDFDSEKKISSSRLPVGLLGKADEMEKERQRAIDLYRELKEKRGNLAEK